MQNLEQKRAANALRATSKKDGNDPVTKPVTKDGVNRLPAMIVNNGLLAAAAFVVDGKEEMLKAMDAVASHLRRVNRLDKGNDTKGMLAELSACQSTKLRLATAEALAFLSYLKRFALKGNEKKTAKEG